jgi:hypothetical protein
LAGLEVAAGLATDTDVHVDVIERGPSTRRQHIQWDKTVHAGDEKVRRWSSDGWGVGGGLSERLGGRSLCWNGVLLGIEQPALDAWPAPWQARLVGSGGFYEQIYADLDGEFPAISRRRLSRAAGEIGLRHVPQCVVYDPQRRRLRSYSPLGEIFRLAASSDRLTITRGAAERLRQHRTGGWVVELGDDQQPGQTIGPVDLCILAASAIGNVQVIARSAGDTITTRVTDHMALGAIVRIHRGDSLGAFEHREIWHGYTPIPGSAGNAFVVELGALPNGERVVELMAVLEQGDGPADYSVLTVDPGADGTTAGTSIATQLTTRDVEALGHARQGLARLAESIAETSLVDVSCEADAPSTNVAAGDRSSADARWSGRDDAFRAVVNHSTTDCVAIFSFPYGSFEHEACSHPMGSASSPAVDESLQVVGLPGVYAVGPGSFPRMGAANPALTLLSLSRWLAAELTSHA